MDPKIMQGIKKYVGFRRNIASDIHKTYLDALFLPKGAHSKKSFMEQFHVGWYKTTLLKTSVGKVFIDIDGQYNHLNHNSKNQDRFRYSKSIAETLKNPVFIAKYDDGHYKFYKNFIEKNGTIAHIFCIVKEMPKGKALMTMYNVTEQKVMKLYEEIMRSSPRNLPRQESGTTTGSVILGNVIVNEIPLISDKNQQSNTQIINNFLKTTSEIKPNTQTI